MTRGNQITKLRTMATAALPLLAVAASASWSVSPGNALAQVAQQTITKEQASQSARQAIPGNVTDITIERKLGKNVYVVEIVAEKGGEETDVLVDMVSGKVLGIER